MALTTNNYTPKGIAINNPLGATDLFPSKTLVPGSDGSLTTNSVMFPTMDQNPLGYEDLQTLDAKYNIDLAKATAIYKKQMFPFQWMTDVNAKPSSSGDVHIQAEDHDQNIMFHDTMMNKLRIASAGAADSSYSLNKALEINDTLNFGGMLKWRRVTTNPRTGAFTDIHALLAAFTTGSAGTTAIANVLVDRTADNSTPATSAIAYDTPLYKGVAGDSTSGAITDHMILPLCWSLASSGEDSRCANGTDAMTYVTKLAALLEGNYYKKVGQGAAGTDAIATANSVRVYGYVHENAGAGFPDPATVHYMFDDLAIKVNGSEMQLHEVSARVYGFLFSADYKEFIVLLDMTMSNMEEVTLSSTATSNIILLEEIFQYAENFTGGFTRLSQHALLGMFTSLPNPIAQGFDSGTIANYQSGYQYDVQVKENYCQIIESPKIKISGTYLASQNRIKINSPQKMRDDLMMKFKQYRTNVRLYGKGATHRRIGTTAVSGVGAAGDFINTSAGLFCYQHNPIRYMRMTLNFSAAASKMESFRAFVNNYARSLFAFQPELQGNGTKQVLISKFMASKIDEYLKLAQQETNNIYGQNAGYQPRIDGSNINLDIKYSSVTTPYGTLEFIVDPALDYMVEFKLPGFVSTGNVPPKYIMLAIDKSKISTVSLRAPRLFGNIQTNSADFTMEKILCEETLEVLNPMTHALSIVNIV